MTTSPGALSSCSAEKPRRKRVLDDKACEVCHDKSTGKHYGVYVCDGCSGFFKRSVRRSVPWVCRSNGNCVVDKASRTECRACRFKKCLMVNMNPEGVQTPRGSRMTHERKNASSDSDSNNSFSRNPSPNSEMSGSGFYEGREHSKYDKNDQDTGTKFAKIDISSQSKTKRSSPLQPDSPPLSMAVPAVGGELQHQIDSPVMVKLESQRHDPHGSDDDVNNIDNESEKETDPSRRPSNNSQVVAGQPNNVEPVGPGQHRLAQIVPFAARRPECYNQGVTGQMHPLIVPDSSFTPYGGPTSRFSATSSFPRYVAAVPHIRSTTTKPIPLSCPPSDSMYSMAVRLLSSAVKFAKNIPSFKLLPFRDQVILLEESWKDLFILDAAYWSFPLEVSYVVNPMELKKEVNSSLIASLRVLQELVARVQALEMDDAECAYLKTIVIFKPDIKGLKDSQQVEKLQDDTQVKFSEYVRAKRGDNPARFGRLLLTLLTFERVTQEVIEKLFFRTQSENVSVEYILHDMFKSN